MVGSAGISAKVGGAGTGISVGVSIDVVDAVIGEVGSVGTKGVEPGVVGMSGVGDIGIGLGAVLGRLVAGWGDTGDMPLTAEVVRSMFIGLP